MRSPAGYWLGGALCVAAVGAAILWAVVSFVRMVDTIDDFVRVRAPSAQTVTLAARTYVVFLEGPGAGSDFRPPIEFAIVDARNERRLPVADYGGSLTYSFGAHDGTATATVTPPRAGRYIITVGSDFEASAGYGVALGESIAGRIVRAILGAVLIGGLLLFVGIGMIVRTAVLRKRAGSQPAGIAGLEG